ncbi:PEP-CTERM sorting domain-containing protein [Motiliproteus sp.]|uniref:PEP-CTERM sorting domain-containing protein n=1 Tax=Motiliproteus sp. TaxID=1898955 RepID=UPI003BA84A02
MKKLTLATVATASLLVSSGQALASDMYIDVGSNTYESAPNILDANSTTGIFNEFGFSQLLATSVYDFSDGSPLGAFYDTNIASELGFANVPAAGLALDGVTNVNLVSPNCAGGQCDIDALSPLVPPLGSDSEGFLLTWDLQLEYHFDGTLTPGGPVYTGGFVDVIFNDFNNDLNDRVVLTATLTGSDIQAANLNLFFDITFAEVGFLFIEQGGTFVDAAAGIPTGNYAEFILDTNVNPPIPTLDQLLLVVDDGGNPNAIRQTTLDGSVTAQIPEPGTLALFGLGLLGLGATARRKFS